MPPRLRSLAPRLGLTGLGGVCFAVGIVTNIQANVGQGSWVAFHYGLSLHTPLTIGQANVAMSVAMIAISFVLGVRPGVGTLLSVAVVGWFVDSLLYSQLIPRMSGLLDGYAMLIGGVVIMTLGTALMVKANLGTGPRDSFMLALLSLTGLRVGLVKGIIEVTVLALGYLMGAPVGIGTLVYAASIGPAVEIWFRIFRLRPRRGRPTPAHEAGAST